MGTSGPGPARTTPPGPGGRPQPAPPPQPPRPRPLTPQQQQQQQLLRRRQQMERRRQLLAEELAARRAEHAASYPLPLTYPARVAASPKAGSVAAADGGGGVGGVVGAPTAPRSRTSPEFVNARLLESGAALGRAVPPRRPAALAGGEFGPSALARHGASVGRFVRDLEGTGCYDSVRVEIDRGSRVAGGGDGDVGGGAEGPPGACDVSVYLEEKNWYKLYVGGGVNSDDLTSLGGGMGGGGGNHLLGSLGGGSGLGAAVPKVQFEASASLLNLTGFADVSSASYAADQTGASSFRVVHDRPLVAWVPRDDGALGGVRRWLMPPDPRDASQSQADVEGGGDGSYPSESEVFSDDEAQYALGGGSHATLGVHATFHEVDREHIRSSKEYVRSVGTRLANHSRGASRSSLLGGGGGGGGGAHRPSTSPPEAMAGPYLHLDWSLSLADALPKRSSVHPFALDCSPQVAREAGTRLKHSLTAGARLNGCVTDDRYDPTMGYDARLEGEVAGPPGDAGFWKVRGAGAWHCPLELLSMALFGVDGDDGGGASDGGGEDAASPLVVGPAMHSSFQFGIVRPLTFNGLVDDTNRSAIPPSDRFYVGGPLQLRGFLPAGIGPRSSDRSGGSGGSSGSPGGDALGGDFFYATTFALSAPFPSRLGTLRNSSARVFGFANAGTCVSLAGLSPTTAGMASPFRTGLGMGSLPPLNPALGRILNSTRLAVGCGISAGTPLGRLEATCALPVRYGPLDARRSVQLGFGLDFG
ncbi:hypothetical protein ACHAWF_006218 [Thalassiosira exigua]